MEKSKLKLKDRKKLSFKNSTLKLIQADEQSRTLRREDEPVFKGLSRHYLEARNVTDNREMGRKIGVESATTLNKEELINAMLDKLWGIQHFSEDTPILNEADVEKLQPEDELSVLENVKYGELLLGTDVEGVYESGVVGGILRVKRFVSDIHDVCVIRALSGQYRLRDGDFIKGRAVFLKTVGFFCLCYIETLNGVDMAPTKGRGVPEPASAPAPVRPFKRIRLACPDSHPLLRLIDFFTPVCQGQFALLAAEGRAEETEFMAEVYRSVKFSGQADEVLCLCLYEREERIAYLQNTYKSIIFTALTDPEEENAVVLRRALAYAGRMASVGRNIAVVLNSITRLKYDSRLAVGEVVSAARQYESGGSVTVIAGADRENFFGVYYEIKNLADMECRFKVNPYTRTYRMDVKSSYSFSDLERSEDERLALAKVNGILEEEGDERAVQVVLRYPDNKALIRELAKREKKS
ncbi:MAG: hypothetical protein LBH24_00185 [Clostridiales bacterium]|jgi:transcription termination factor Rho|nr:hypothetical protein [Clostridiales bacterium]